MSKTISILLLTLTSVHSCLSQHPLVQLPNGQVLGREDVTAQGTTYCAFEGIPYGKPPTGDLRFKAPQPAEPWEGVLNATTNEIICYQLTATFPRGIQSEDCLRLNVFTPNLLGSELLPVMVYIHGGGFHGGSTFDYPPDLFVDNEVILVSIYYRVGVFGFASSGDEVIPGNFGLKDQLLSLHWVQDNINFFGGDPEKVTVFGQSAGAGSVAYLLLNPEAADLIAGAIIESGSFLSPGMFQRNPRPKIFYTGENLNTQFETDDNSTHLLEFLLSVDADDLNAAALQHVTSVDGVWTDFLEKGSFSPVIEAPSPEAFLSEKQYGLLKAGSVVAVPTMMGFAVEEKIKFYQNRTLLEEATAFVDESIHVIVPDDMLLEGENQTEVGMVIRDFYTNGTSFAENFGGAIRYSSDNFLTRAMIKQAEMFSSFAPIYFYQFSFDGELDHQEVHYDGAGTVPHGSELKYLFCSGMDCVDSSIPDADLLTRRRVIKIWTDFGKYQNPTPEASELLQDIIWPQVDTTNGDFHYLDINGNLEVMNHPKTEYYAMWTGLYDSLGFDDFDTY